MNLDPNHSMGKIVLMIFGAVVLTFLTVLIYLSVFQKKKKSLIELKPLIFGIAFSLLFLLYYFLLFILLK
jgi:hypothetical protein